MPNTEKNAGHIQVIARPKSGFRRAGFNFSATEPTLIAVDDLTAEQLLLLREEPNLVVIEASAVVEGTAPDAALAEAREAAAAADDLLDRAGREIQTLEAERDALAEKLAAAEAERDALAEKLKAGEDAGAEAPPQEKPAKAKK